ncbi:hypothetical protein JAB6_21710 [Janthinobacterium sp. HH104]|uniref:AAA family ATPase n=1 Tax=Janthinobacterium sp. HH104 TaxID=1537276 RepID=UPI000892C135|nr:AAA family ATPase [Janthinobacterium sp. HH104]OEZ85322.1 hypothetical protein JAB6_21710 [Janthinobacterium sp. HH104]
MKKNEENKNKFAAFFGSAANLHRQKPPYSVYISPSNDTFNDFGYKPRVRIVIVGNDSDQILDLEGRLGFLDGSPANHTTLEAILNESKGLDVPATTERHRFFTILPDMEAYRRVVERFGPKLAQAALLAANDLVAMKELRPSLRLHSHAERTEVFRLSFMRMSDTYFAYQRAGSVLRGLVHEEIGGIHGDMTIRFMLAGRSNHHEIAFRFEPDSVLPKRISVIIGKNGVGKSQTLARVAHAALKRSPSLVGADGTPILVSRLLAFAPTADSLSLFPSPKNANHRVSYFRLTVGATNRGSVGITASVAIRDLLRMKRRIKGVTRWKIFLDSLDVFSDARRICLVTNSSDVKFISLEDLEYAPEKLHLERLAAVDWKKDPVRVIDGRAYKLSTGELSFIKFAAQASALVENGSLLLFDEPETHLHPNFISRFMSLLDYLLQQTGSVAVVATHSVYFVREVFREQVTVLRTDETGSVLAERPRMRTFGGDVGAISFFVFGEDGPSSFAAQLTDRLVKSGQSWSDIERQYGDELSPEFLMQLRRRMELGKSE